MDSLPECFDRFFDAVAVPRDESGYLRTLAEVLQSYHPRLLYFDADDGTVAVAVELDAQTELDLAAGLAREAQVARRPGS